jgi:GNAT superfamily N-acetyltransferase
VESAGQPIGCLNVEWLPGEVKLKRVFLLPVFQNRGIGSRLVRQVLSEAKSTGLPVRLRVFKVNPAQRLWQRLGFVVSGETDSHILMEHAAFYEDGPVKPSSD